MIYSYADPVVATFVLLPMALAILLVWGTLRAWRQSGASDTAPRVALLVAIVAIAWMGLTWTLAASGVLRRWEQRPPPFGLLVAAIVAIATTLAMSPVGRRLAGFTPLWALVAVQTFRLPLELAMHTMAERRVMPEQMTYSGRNFDIVTGGTALLVSTLVFRGWAGPRLVMAWNLMGLALLINVVVVAVLSTPFFQYFGTDQLNVWVTYPPFVWLPAVLVLAALAGHLLIFRALRTTR
jgi:hypothetical protein